MDPDRTYAGSPQETIGNKPSCKDKSENSDDETIAPTAIAMPHNKPKRTL